MEIRRLEPGQVADSSSSETSAAQVDPRTFRSGGIGDANDSIELNEFNPFLNRFTPDAGISRAASGSMESVEQTGSQSSNQPTTFQDQSAGDLPGHDEFGAEDSLTGLPSENTVVRLPEEKLNGPEDLPDGLKSEWYQAEQESQQDMIDERADQWLNAAEGTGIFDNDAYRTAKAEADDFVNSILNESLPDVESDPDVEEACGPSTEDAQTSGTETESTDESESSASTSSTDDTTETDETESTEEDDDKGGTAEELDGSGRSVSGQLSYEMKEEIASALFQQGIVIDGSSEPEVDTQNPSYLFDGKQVDFGVSSEPAPESDTGHKQSMNPDDAPRHERLINPDLLLHADDKN